MLMLMMLAGVDDEVGSSTFLSFLLRFDLDVKQLPKIGKFVSELVWTRLDLSFVKLNVN